MRIAWFTPFTKNSAIGKYSQVVTDGLSKICEIDIWSAESDNLLPTRLKVFHYMPEDNLLQKLDNYDYIVYNIGDSTIFHKTIYEASKKFKGIVILHDIVMHHFFARYYIIDKSNPEAYTNEMTVLYGAKGRDAAIDSIGHKRIPIWETDEVMDYPLFERTIEGATGVIVHSKYHSDVVKPRFLGPIEIIYHPYYSYSELANELSASRAELGLPPDKVIMISVGHVNPNKQIDKVVEVLGEDEEIAKKVLYIVIGPSDDDSSYLTQIRSSVEKYRLDDVVKFLGFQPEDKLRAFMSNADVFVNLRFPSMEGASWSLVEELYFGKPVIVTKTGFYGELPDDCIIKIDPNNEKEELRSSLRKLINDKCAREDIGKKGQDFAYANFSADKYSARFFDFLNTVQDFKPLIDLVDKVGKELDQMGASSEMGAINKASYEIQLMFNK